MFCSNKSAAVNQFCTVRPEREKKIEVFLIPRAGAVDCVCGQCVSAVLVGCIEPEISESQ